MKLLWEMAPESLRIKETIESDERARSRAAKLVDFYIAPRGRQSVCRAGLADLLPCQKVSG
jgi:hypothetical protein